MTETHETIMAVVFIIAPSKLVQVANCNQKVACSNTCRDTNYFSLESSWFSSARPGKSRDIRLQCRKPKPLPHPSTVSDYSKIKHKFKLTDRIVKYTTNKQK
jgi:hypothetical protein